MSASAATRVSVSGFSRQPSAFFVALIKWARAKIKIKEREKKIRSCSDHRSHVNSDSSPLGSGKLTSRGSWRRGLFSSKMRTRRGCDSRQSLPSRNSMTQLEIHTRQAEISLSLSKQLTGQNYVAEKFLPSCVILNPSAIYECKVD